MKRLNVIILLITIGIAPLMAQTAVSYQTHISRGQTLFEQCDYMSARDEFRSAAKASGATQAQRTAALQQEVLCDSVMTYRKLGYLASDRLDYEEALENFNALLRHNPHDEEVIEAANECLQNSGKMCDYYMHLGNTFMKRKDYQEAIDMFLRVERRNCGNANDALIQRLHAEKFLKERKAFGGYVGIEMGETNGLTYATLRRTTGGYLSMKANTAFFKIAQSNRKLEDKANIEVTGGWTYPIIKKKESLFGGLWMHYGIGAVASNQYEEGEGEYEGYKEWNVGWAAIPEIGFDIKVWKMALRTTFQYRYLFNDRFENTISKSTFYVGLGYCW